MNIKKIYSNFIKMFLRKVFMNNIRKTTYFTRNPDRQYHYNWMKDIKIYSIINDNIIKKRKNMIFHQDDTIRNVAKALRKNNTSSCLITNKDNNDEILGIVSERDFVNSICDENIKENDSIQKVMTPLDNIVYARLSDSVIDVLEKMTDKHIRHIPIINKDNQVEGFISMRDISEKIVELQEFEIDELVKYIQGIR